MHLVPEHDDTAAATPVVDRATTAKADGHVRPRRRRGLLIAALVTHPLYEVLYADGFLPDTISDSGKRVTDLWIGSWIAVLAVGAITWGLMLYAAVRFRKRKGDETLPVQLRYNVPVEMLYTIVPVFMVAVFFYYTARDEAALTDTSKKPDVTISVVAKQWSWDFNYIDSNVHESGVHVDPSMPDARSKMPTLYLP